MSTNLSTLARNVMGAALANLLDEGSAHPSAYMEIRTGVKPVTPETAPSGVFLATLQFSNPAYGQFVNGIAEANPIISDTNIAETGVAGWVRIYNRDGAVVLDGDVTITSGNGEVRFDNIKFVKGGTVNLAALPATMPV